MRLNGTGGLPVGVGGIIAVVLAGHRRPALARRVSLLTCLAVLLLLPSAAIAAEEETHVFNATLSLTGDCTTATIDPVPDPGCPEGAHPPKPFNKHGAVAVDQYGDRYVLSAGGITSGSEGRIDIFDPSGEFIAQVPVAIPFDGTEGPLASLAVDSDGYLYLGVKKPEQYKFYLFRYAPTKYNPAAGEIAYGTPSATIPQPPSSNELWTEPPRLVVDPSDDHLYVARTAGYDIEEFGSAAEGNPYLEGIGLEGTREGGKYIGGWALDSVRKRIVVADVIEVAGKVKSLVKVFDQEAPPDPEDPHQLLFTIDGSTTPTERFVSETRYLPLAVDEATGHIFVGDLNAPTRRVYEFDADGEPVSTIEAEFKSTTFGQLQMAYDDSPISPTEGYLFVPSHNGPGRSLAFAPKPVPKAPEVEALSVSGVSEEDAILHGKVNPKGQQTSYRFEYTTEQAFQSKGFAGATLAGAGTLESSNEGLAVSAALSGLEPGTAYRFGLFAESPEGEAQADAGFATYGPPQGSSDCPNQSLRTGPSAALPDCRAYELVTPADTSGRLPVGTRQDSFTNRQVAPGGERLRFQVEGGSLPGFGGVGSFTGDPYLASRTPEGWSTAYTGPSGTEAISVIAGSPSPDQQHYFWIAEVFGSATVGGTTSRVGYPDGHSIPLGQGSVGFEREAKGELISEGGGHIIFRTGGGIQTPVQLEPEAAPDGTRAIYDRTADGTLHVVSLKPDGSPFGAGENAFYQGASLDGEGVAFEVDGTLYLRYDDKATFTVGEGAEYAGLAEGGDRIFYVEGGEFHGNGDYLGGGDLKALDAQEGTIAFSDSGDVTPVQVSADGSAAYFVSPSVLTPGEKNPEDAEAQPGAQNLYLSREGKISFVATVTDRDVEGDVKKGFTTQDGLGLWVNALPEGSLSFVPARTSNDGGVLLFSSRAALTDYDPEGPAEIYRYDSVGGELDCLSCNPTGVPASSDASLQARQGGSLFFGRAWLENLRADGRRAFFQSREGLVAADLDGVQDVYQWEDEGVGDCKRSGGCVSLISSPQSGRDEYLWAVSASGNDVFFLSPDLLVEADRDETPSIYDARVGGGFAPPTPPAGECLGEACQPAAEAPQDATPAAAAFHGAGNVAEQRSCGAIARRAAKLSRQARRLRRQAGIVKSQGMAERLRREAESRSRQAKALAKRAQKCRHAVRRAAR